MTISEKELVYPRRAKEIGYGLIDYGNLLLESARWESIEDRPYVSIFLCNKLEKATRELRELVEYMEFNDAH